MSNHESFEHERAALRRATPGAADPAADAGPTPHPLLALQRQVGNARIARMLAQREATPEDEDELQMRRDPAVQREAAPEDEDELQMRRDPTVQREATPEDEDELQMRRDVPEIGLEGGPVSDEVAGRIQSKRGGGAALDEGMQTKMEESFGDSFADVRLHTDAESHQLNRSLGAQAFTTGSDIFFGPNGNPGDHDLLAHELTHVVQQRDISGGGPLTVGPADDSYEREADSMARAVTSGSAAAAQRKAEDEQ
jgi:hypothetical protein